MEYSFRKLGDITVSPIGMGCMGFSHGYGAVPEERYSIEAIQAAHDFGCTFFDTAETYGDVMFHPGHNEELVGKAIKDFRNDIVLATKFHYTEEDIQSERPLYEKVRSHLEKSMARLQTDYVDLYYLHRMNDAIPVEEVAHVMGRLIADGLIRGWGLSQVGVDTLATAHKVTPVSAVQNLYNMLERDCEKDIFPFTMEHGIGVVPFSPTASGLLSGKITTSTKFEGDDVRKWIPQLSKENIEGNRPIISLISELAEKKNATPAQISMAWMLTKYPDVVPIPGSKNKERIIENLGAWNVSLSSEEFTELERALAQLKVFGHRGHQESEGVDFSKNWKK